MVIQNNTRNCMNQKRKAVFERDNHECRYCGGNAEVVDHIIPWSFRHNDDEENLAASCQLCNAFVNNKMFRSFGDKKEYILRKRFGRERNTPIAIWLLWEIETLGKTLREKIEHTVVVVETDAEAERIRAMLKSAGYKIRG